jgi:Ala-tRNA(Pro) deacylase
MTPEELLSYLDELGIATRTVRHPAVYTVEQARQHRQGLTGGFTKNLFLRNKKGRMLLVVAEESRPLHLKSLGRGLGAGNLSFASAERLQRYLGLVPGAVSPFGLVNDTEGAVSVVIDRSLEALDPLHFHPLDNAMTTAISPGDLLRFIEATGHAFQLVDLAPFTPGEGRDE